MLTLFGGWRRGALLCAFLATGCQGVLNPEIDKAEQAVKAELRDPDSAKFSSVERCGTSNIVSGNVNAKNVYGAYAGDLNFYSDGSNLMVFPLEENGPFTAAFVSLHRDDTPLLIQKCTAAIQGKDPSKVEAPASDLNATDMNATDMNSTVLAPAAAPTSDEVSAADEPMDDYTPAERSNADKVERAALSQYPGNCYKDYCPCDPPQGGPDMVLCDQLEAGQDVDINLMIAGRGMREVRRQLATGDY